MPLFESFDTSYPRVIPKIGSEWIHRNTGNPYTIFIITNEWATLEKQPKFPITVVYTRGGKFWSRKLEDFLLAYKPREEEYETSD